MVEGLQLDICLDQLATPFVYRSGSMLTSFVALTGAPSITSASIVEVLSPFAHCTALRARYGMSGQREGGNNGV